MSDVPSELFREILRRLPAESLLRFRSVCKAWRLIIDDSTFIKSHINHQLSPSSLGQLLIKNFTTGTGLYSLSLDSLNFADGRRMIEVTPVKALIRRDVPRLPNLPVPSCNGLILISHVNVNKVWALWNPITRECHELPAYIVESRKQRDFRLLGSGLGYDCVADDYKVVRIDQQYLTGKAACKTSVYSLKLNSWRRIKDFPCGISSQGRGVFLNGALYWSTWDMIIALDIGIEDFRQLPLPPGAHSEHNLDVLGGCLVLSCKYKKTRLDGWMMKDDGGNISWNTLFSFKELDMIGAMGTLRPITYLRSKRWVLLQHDNEFFWLDTVNNSAKKVKIDGLANHFSSQICPGSLFRFNKNSGVGGSIAAKKTIGVKRERASTRLNLTVRTAYSWYRLES